MVDLDGTLARTAEANLQAYLEALQRFGVSISPAELEQRIGGRNWKQFLPAVLTEAGATADPAEIAACKAEIYRKNLSQLQLNHGLIRAILASRPQLKIALVTSASRVSVDALVSVHKLAPLFDVIVTGDDVSLHKPDPEAYCVAAERLGVSPQETLVYEDSEIGVASAQAFGAQVIRVIF